MRLRILILILALMLFPSLAPAYIDPGILSAAYQVAYLAFFGLISALILRPWRFLKSWYSRVFGKHSENTDDGE